MKHFVAIMVILAFVLPSVAPMLPHGIQNALHTIKEEHHWNASSEHGHKHGQQVKHHGGYHAFFAENQDHPPHVDIVSYFENLHVDLKNPPVLKLKTASSIIKYIPYISVTHPLVTDLLLVAGQSQPPPELPLLRFAAQSAPVYLTTQRLRI